MTVDASGVEYAARLDEEDSLASYRSRFYLDPARIYLDGNSLGLLSRDAEAAVDRALSQWRELAIDGWTEGSTPWFTFAEQLAADLAPLVGAASEEVIVANSTTVNLHQALSTLYRPEGPRRVIFTDGISFPSDLYAVASHLRLRGVAADAHRQVPPVGRLLDEDTLIGAMTDDVALALFPAVVYTTGQLLDMERLAAAAQERGIVIGFDCSHSVGAVPHRLSEWGVDFAVWCTYKYLNGGPGGSGGLFLHRRHHGGLPGLAGWFSSDKARQFDMASELSPAPNAWALQIGTPNILSMAPLLGSVAMVQEAGIDRLRRKSLAQTRYLMQLADDLLQEHGFSLANPRDDGRRGGHVSLVHPEAFRICRSLKAEGVVPDFRPPDIIRLAPAPLYTTFRECREAIVRLRAIMKECRYRAFSSERGAVT
jgi:kynureninase